MAGYDIQGGQQGVCSDLQRVVEEKFQDAKLCIVVEPDETAIPVRNFSNLDELRDFINLHWWNKFNANLMNPLFILDGCVIALQSIQFRPASEFGLTINYPTQPQGKRGGVSLISVQRVRDAIVMYDQLKASHLVVSHELGHLIADLKDYSICGRQCHNSENCLMNSLCYNINGQLIDFCHRSFCCRCKDNIQSHNWEW